MTQSAQDIAETISSLKKAGDDRRLSRDRFALMLESAAEADDLAMLRAGKQADDFESDFLSFASGFPGVELADTPEVGLYGVTVALTKLDQEALQGVLLAYADELRKVEGKANGHALFNRG